MLTRSADIITGFYDVLPTLRPLPGPSAAPWSFGLDVFTKQYYGYRFYSASRGIMYVLPF